MTELVTLDGIVLALTFAAGLFGVGMGAWLLQAARADAAAARVGDVSDLVERAPYGRLHNVVRVRPPR